MKKLWPSGLLVLALALTVASYWSGLAGPFLFDDAPNLRALGELGGVRDWVTLKGYVLSGWSGPTGRPLSLLSFLLDDNTWPSAPEGFKHTSLKLHLVCGLLLAWVTYLLMRAAGRIENEAVWLAVLSASIWMLHPLMLSTTLYVVQRMTILSAIFMLAGMVGYLKGRLLLAQANGPVGPAYALMSASVILGTVLAVLSKENGALLPLLLFVAELFLRRVNEGSGPRKEWLAVFFVLPALAVLGYLLWLIDFSPNPWPTRPFNQVERLYSESRIMWDYLRALWFPRIEGSGLFQDGFEISRSLTQPISTLWATLGLAGIVAALPWLYRRLPYIWVALAFYLAGHLTESTVVGLELYFEHRNYAPAFFMFLPLAVGIRWLSREIGPFQAAMAGVGIVAMLAMLTWQRSQLWADSDRLQTYWAVTSPQSARGQNYLLSRLVRDKHYSEALLRANEAIERIPDSPLLTMSWLQLHVSTKQATQHHFEQAAEKLIRQPFDAQAITGIRILTDDVTTVPELFVYRESMLKLIQYLSANGVYKDLPLFLRLVSYIEAKLYLSLGRSAEAYEHYLQAMNQYRQANAAMQMFAEMANAGHLKEAKQMLATIESAIDSGAYDVNPLGSKHYHSEIDRLRILLEEFSLLKVNQ